MSAITSNFEGFDDIVVHKTPISYANDVFFVELRTSGAKIAVAKVTETSYKVQSRTENQVAAAKIVGILSPLVLCARDGSYFVQFDVSSSSAAAPTVARAPSHILTLFQYVDGKSMYDVVDHARSPPLQLMVEYGHALGSLGRQMLRFRAPTAARVPIGLELLACQGSAKTSPTADAAAADECSWDLRHALLHADAAAVIADPAVRALAVAALDEFRRVMLPQYEAAEADARRRCAVAAAAPADGVAPESDSVDPDAHALLRLAWVHGDANDFNVIVTHHHDGHIAGSGLDKAAGGAGSGSSLSAPSTPVAVSAYASVDPSDWCPPEARAAAAAAATAGDAHAHSTSSSNDSSSSNRRFVVIDWDDLTFSFALHEPAVALAYLMMGRADPVAAAAAFLRGYAEVCPLTRSEVACLLTLVRTRLAVSLASSGAAAAAARACGEAEAARAAYIEVHATPAARLLRYLSAAHAAGPAVGDAAAPVSADAAATAAAHAGVGLGLGGDFAAVHTAPYAGDAAATARLMVACGHLEPPRPARSYWRRPVLSGEQLAASRGTLAALDALAAAGRLHPITPAVLQPAGDAVDSAAPGAAASTTGAAAHATSSSPSSSSSAAGYAYVPDVSQRFCAAPAGWWSVPPLLYDFAARVSGSADGAAAGSAAPEAIAAVSEGGSASAGSIAGQSAPASSASSTPAGGSPLAAVVGTDPAKLQAFTAMMFEPLALPPAGAAAAAGCAGAASTNASAAAAGGAAAHADAPPSAALRLAPAAAPAPRLRIGWGRYNEDRMIYTSGHFTGGADADVDARAGSEAADADADAGAGAGVAEAAGGVGPDAAVVRGTASDAEARTLHMGVDVELPAGTPITAPLPGLVHSWARNWAELDYGPAIILQHSLRLTRRERERQGAGADGSHDSGSSSSSSTEAAPAATHDDTGSESTPHVQTQTVTFYTLYGHLSLSSILNPDGSWRLRPGQAVPAGGVVGWVGGPHVNGGWPPHLHLQLNTEAGHGGWQGDYPGVCARGDWVAYRLLCPDPNALLRCPYVPPLGPWGGAREDAGAAAGCGGAAFDAGRAAAAITGTASPCAASDSSDFEWVVESLI